MMVVKKIKAENAARDAAAQDIMIHTVTFSDEAQQGLMRQTAEAAGGQHFHAPDAAALERIFREIALTSIDAQFLERAMMVIETHLAEPDFETEAFGREIGFCVSSKHAIASAATIGS